jgi:hypothetical protein
MNKSYFLNFRRNLSFLAIVFLLLIKHASFSQTTTVTALSGGPAYTFCSGVAINVTYTITGTFTAGNVFTAQLSNSSGSFVSGVTTIGTKTTTTGSTIACTLPYVSTTSSLYRIRVISSTPAAATTTDNGFGFTVNALTINIPTVNGADSCQSEIFTVAYTIPCSPFPAGNVFTAQLINATGTVSIGSATTTVGGNITCTIPAALAAGNYSLNVVSTNTVAGANGITSPSNTLNVYASSVPAGGVGTPGNGFWNAYCYSGYGNYTTNYMGYYTENNLNLNSTLRNSNTASPCTANNASGNAYAGCPYSLPGTLYGVRYIRTGIPCGYYSINISSEDDQAIVLINGSSVFTSTACCTNWGVVWQGFVAPTTTVEIRYSNNGGPGNLTASVTAMPSGLTMSTPVTICAGTTGNISATNSYTTGFTYSWLPAATATLQTAPTANPSNADVSPTTSTIYTVTATDSNTLTATGCSMTNTINVTVNPVPTTTATSTYSVLTISSYTSTATCYGVTTATLNAGGASSYTWAPASGIIGSVNSYSVVANPSVTTTYTVSGSNNCSVVTATTSVLVQTEPTSPATTTFGSNVWNAYCNANTTFNDYYGYYTENNLSFNTTTRWNNNNGPSTCTNTTTGAAYNGCSFPGTEWSMSLKRTGTPCGYYSLDINYQDDALSFWVNGVQVFNNATYTTVTQTGVWQGFIGPTTTLEFRLINYGGPGQMQVTFNPIAYPVLSPPVTICSSSPTTTLTSSYISGVNYVWNDGYGGSSLSTTTGTITVATPSVTTNYTCTATDPVTTCSASASVLVTVSTLTNVAVSPTTATISCPANIYTLTATGANTYSWSPTSGLSSATGYSVIATPTVTTNYTVTGSDNCGIGTATANITVVPLATPTVFPSGTWNAYCYGDQTLTNYYGYYTENGGGPSGYDFNTTTRWTSVASGTITPSPSKANNTNGTAYAGCVIPNTNFSISFKRTGFTCGTYSVNVTQDDYFYLFVNGVQVAQRTSAAGSENGVWVGTLNTNSTVEIRLVQVNATSSLTVTFVPVTPPATQYTWIGGTSTDWFTASNWCGGGGSIPTSAYDVVIPAAGPQNMPVINNNGAQCRSITINPAIAAGTYNNAIAAAGLTINGTYTLDVYGNWNNSGSFTSNNSTVNMDGTTAATMSCSTNQTFYNLNINNSAGVTMSSGTQKVSNNLNFTNGVITQNATLQVLNGGTASGASNTGYVIGPIVKYGNQAFTFPVGGDNLYRPIAISAPSLTTDNFTAQYFYANAYISYPTTTWDPGIDHLSECEYWILNRTGGTSNVNVTLSWNTNSCGVTDLPSLLVARWDAGSNVWKNHGNGGTTGNTTTGTIITSAPVTNFSPFILASSSATTNPLPIELLYFTASAFNNTVDLNWATETETNNQFFTVEKSRDGIDFEFLKQVNSEAVNGNSTTTLNYKTYDLNPYDGINYYRLKQTDYNGHYKYTPVAEVNFAERSFVSVFPNPASNSVYINVSADYDNASLKFLDALGREVLAQNISSSYTNTINTSGLTSGMYYLIIGNGNGVNKTKVTIQK